MSSSRWGAGSSRMLVDFTRESTRDTQPMFEASAAPPPSNILLENAWIIVLILCAILMAIAFASLRTGAIHL